ncbi:MAG: IS110 family transposase [bacterium]
MGKFTLVGADVHDKSILVKVAVDRGPAVVRRWENNRDGRQAMIGNLKRVAAESGAKDIRFVYEASGEGFGLHDDLADAGIWCDVLAPTKIKKSAQDRKQKTDEKDAERLLELVRGHVLAGNPLPAVWVPDPQTRDDREVVRGRLDVGEKISGVKAQVKALLKRNGVRRASGTGKGWSWEYRVWLKGLSQEGEELGSGGRAALSSLLGQLNFLEEECGRLDQAIEELAKTERYAGGVKEMRKFKGVGLLTAMVFLTEMGNLGRFNNRREVGAYVGLVPCTSESGEQNDRKGHITREGPGRLRKVLCQAALARVRHDAGEKEFYDRLAARNPKHKKKAVVAVMRRLAIRMWHAGLRGLPA